MRRINLLIAAIGLVATACGYHLRGSVDMPVAMKKLYIQGAGPGLIEAMRASLNVSDAVLVGSPDQAGLVIRVARDDMRRRVLSLNESGKATEFELTYTLEYVLLNSQGQVLSNTLTTEINRDYFNDQEDILAKNNEEIVIRQEIYRQAVRSIFARASAVLSN